MAGLFNNKMVSRFKHLQGRTLVEQFAPVTQTMIFDMPPIYKSILELFEENFLADVGAMAYTPKGCAIVNFKSEGFKQLYEILKPE